MALTSTYTVQMAMTERLEATITDATEAEVWREIEDGLYIPDKTREEYEGLGDEEKAEFLAIAVVSLGLDYAESTGTNITVFDVLGTDGTT
jgi:hypothetical protein